MANVVPTRSRHRPDRNRTETSQLALGAPCRATPQRPDRAMDAAKHGTGTVGRVRVAIIGAGPHRAVPRWRPATARPRRDRRRPRRWSGAGRQLAAQGRDAVPPRACVPGAGGRSPANASCPRRGRAGSSSALSRCSRPAPQRSPGIRSQRSTFERALHDVVAAEPGLVLRRWPRGCRCGTSTAWPSASTSTAIPLAAELSLDASGRSSPVTRELGERDGFGGDCGIAYVDRLYRLRPGAEPGPLNGPIAWQGDFDGYQVLVFPHEAGIFSTVIMRQEPRRPAQGAPPRRGVRRGLRGPSPGSPPGPTRSGPSRSRRCSPVAAC